MDVTKYERILMDLLRPFAKILEVIKAKQPNRQLNSRKKTLKLENSFASFLVLFPSRIYGKNKNFDFKRELQETLQILEPFVK